MTPKAKIAVVVAAVVLVYLLGDFLIVTEMERLQHTIAELREAVAAADAERCISFISPDYLHNGESREQLLEIGRRIFQRTGPMEVQEISKKKPKISGREAVYESRMVVTFTKPGDEMLYSAGKLLSEWRLTFKKEGDRWLIYQVEPISINNQPIGGRGLRALPQ